MLELRASYNFNRIILSSLLIFIFIHSQHGQSQRWYYTGRVRNEIVTNSLFDGIINTPSKSTLNTPLSNYTLYYGGILLEIADISLFPKTADSPDLGDMLWIELLGYDMHQKEFLKINKLCNYKMLVSVDYGGFPSNNVHKGINYNITNELVSNVIYQVEIGLYDHHTQEFLEKEWKDLSVGNLYSLDITIANSLENYTTYADLSIDGSTSINSLHQQNSNTILSKHHIVFTIDLKGKYSIYTHTWKHIVSDEHGNEKLSLDNNDSNNGNNGNNNNHEKTQKEFIPIHYHQHNDRKVLRLMTYNLWHNNPPSWIYHDPNKRWKRYESRLRHFADIVVAEDPDIITIQEVRLDSAFSSMTGYNHHWVNHSSFKSDSGSQVEHLLSHLTQARIRAKVSSSSSDTSQLDMDYYQVVYQPAMSMLNLQKPHLRNEEGVLILTKAHLPIIDYHVLLLPRDMKDPSDDHQRIVLNAKVHIPSEYIHYDHHIVAEMDDDDAAENNNPTIVNTSDQKKSKSSPLISDQDIDQQHPHPLQQEDMIPSPIQILAGDFNAEPHENAIKYLLNDTSFNNNQHQGNTTVIHQTPFIDSWDYINNPKITSPNYNSIDKKSSKGRNDDQIMNGYTFPACDPIKRIDFILIRNHSSSMTDILPYSPKIVAKIVNSFIAGINPTKDTEHLVNSREGLGMNDLDSPLWASDHYAIVTDFEISYQ